MLRGSYGSCDEDYGEASEDELEEVRRIAIDLPAIFDEKEVVSDHWSND